MSMIINRFLVIISALVIFSFGIGNLRAESLARSIFMSTAGSVIKESPKKDQTDTRRYSVSSKSSKKDVIVANKGKNQWAFGIQVQVLKVAPNNKLVPINPVRHIFKEGDRFKVRVSVNTPGIIGFYNIDPKGEETFLGAWPIERAFSAVELPYEGAFEFYKTKGDDLLIIAFKPCIVTEDVKRASALSGYSRSIRYVETELSEKLSLDNQVSESLPMCSVQRDLYTEERFKEKRSQLISYSRSIRVVSDNVDNSIYAFSANSKSANAVQGDSLIVHMLKLKFR